MNFNTAYRIAKSWVEIVSEGKADIDKEHVITKPYGWIFYWNSKEYLTNPLAQNSPLVGNVPIFVDRVNGDVIVTGPYLDEWCKNYEATIPPARLQMTPEQPTW